MPTCHRIRHTENGALAQKRLLQYYVRQSSEPGARWRIGDGKRLAIIEGEHTYAYGDSNWKDLL
ncbi:MAG: hypothetical protein ACLU9S_17465 [Oscillospiraceae bacterium]